MARSGRAVLLHAALLLLYQVLGLSVEITNQRDAVIQLYQSIDAAGLLDPKIFSSTESDLPLCDILGVICVDGAVDSLALAERQYQGTIPKSSAIWESLGDSIKSLELSNIGLSGSIPVELQAMGETLIELKLNKNYLSGAIPEWTSFLLLQKLDLSDNSLSGTVPESYNTATFPGLTTVDLQDNPRLCGSRDLSRDKVNVTMSPAAYQPACNLRTTAVQICDCLWSSKDSYACSAAKAVFKCGTSQAEEACAVLKGRTTAASICSHNQPPPSPPPAQSPRLSPSPLPQSPKLSPKPSPEASPDAASEVLLGAPESSKTIGTAALISNSNGTSTVNDVCDNCLGSMNNTACSAAVCEYNADACGWHYGMVTPNSGNFTDSAESFSRWLKGDAVCGTRLQYPADLCFCKVNWKSSYCFSAQLEQCIGRKDLCYQIISAPSTLFYKPILDVYSSSCQVNQTTSQPGVQVSLFLINRTVENWAGYQQGVQQALSDVTGIPVDSITGLSAVALPANDSQSSLVQAVVFIRTNSPNSTFNAVLDAFKSPKFTSALSMRGVPLGSADLYASVELKEALAPPKAPASKKSSVDVPWWLIAAICVGIVVLVAVIVAIVFLVKRKKKKEDVWDNMQFRPPPPSVHNSQYSPKPSRSVRLDHPAPGPYPGSHPPSAAPSPTMRASNPYALDPERAYVDPVPGPPIYAGSPYARARYDNTPTTQPSTANSRTNLLRTMGSASNPHTPHQQPASPAMNPLNRDEAQAERAKFWAQFQLSWERQKARQASGVPNHPRVGATFEDDDDIPSSGTSWTSQSDAKHAFRRY